MTDIRSREACEEIERLTRELENARAIANRLIVENVQSMAEIWRLRRAQHVVSFPPQLTTEGVFAMPNHDEQELETLIDALRELAGRLDEDVDRGLIEEAIKAVEALAELEAGENGEDEPAEDGGDNA